MVKVQIVVRDLILDKVVWDSILDGHFDDKLNTLPFMIRNIYNVWREDCYSFRKSHGVELREVLSFDFGGYNYIFSELYWD